MGFGDKDRGRRLSAIFETLLQRLLDEALAVYGDSLTSLVVFGSVGRGTPTADSDIDILVVAKDLPSGRMPRVRQFDEVERRLDPDLAAAKAEGLSTRLSPLFRTESEMSLGGLIFLDMVDDARVLLDRNAFFETFINGLRAKLARMKSIRVRRAGAWHWVLKPDLKPGEVFEI
jgi:hypothetical protein